MPPPSTITDPTAKDNSPSDEPIRVRRWGTDWIEMLPRPTESVRRIELTIGTARECHIRVADPDKLVSSEHARLVCDGDEWKIYDNKSKNGLWIDRQRCEWAPVRAGAEIGLGRKFILIAESARSIVLRTVLARILGWTSDRTKMVDHALRSILVTSLQRGAIVLCSQSDPVAVAHSIHRTAFGSPRPFVTCDPKRKHTKKSVRWTHNFTRGAEALAAASGGTLCVWASRLPRDFGDVWTALVEPTSTVRLVVCSNTPIDGKKFLSVPILVPSLATRQAELRHIIKEYAADAVTELGGEERTHVQPEDLDWTHHNESSSLAKIETATLRLVALRMFPNVNQAAERLGMARMSLASWIGRRKLPMVIET